MRPDVLHTLRTRSRAIGVNWERLLRLESISGPLADPDTLVHLIPITLQHIFDAAARLPGRPLTLREVRRQPRPPCPCGRNPYVAYFTAGEQALLEAVVLLQTEYPRDDRQLSDLAEIVWACRQVGDSEIENFCSVCVLKPAASPQPARAFALSA